MSAIINTEICTGCGRCIEACPVDAISLNEAIRKAVIDSALCIECGACIDKCKKGAISILSSMAAGEKVSPQAGRPPSGRGGSGSSGSWGQGRGTGRGQGGGSGSGGGCGRGSRQRPDVMGECYCPACKVSMPHKAGVPCSQIKCPYCGNPMVRK